MKTYTIKDIQEAFGIKTRQTVYTWLNGLNITVLKGDRNRSYITEDDFRILKDLKRHLDNGGLLKNYVAPSLAETITNPVQHQIDTVNRTLDTTQGEIVKVDTEVQKEYKQMDIFDLLADKVSERLTKTDLSHWDELEKAAEKGYLISTSEIMGLLGAKPKGKVWKRGSFKFAAVAKIGKQTAWKVSKLTF